MCEMSWVSLVMYGAYCTAQIMPQDGILANLEFVHDRDTSVQRLPIWTPRSVLLF